MKRILAVAAVIALLVGCDSKQDAPFGLKWGQSMDSVGFIKDGDCEKKRDETVCVFGNSTPFNEQSNDNALKFNDEGLFKVMSISIGGSAYQPDFEDFKSKLKKEVDFLNSIDFNKEALAGITEKCNIADTCDDIEVSSKTSKGSAEVEIWRSAHDGDHQLVVTFSK
ncbi:hypothetical protein J7S95_18055 [Providencia stuartii]|nr:MULTISPECIES: hypothetical protein [Providencia]AVE42483.1 hypothetical protein AM353_11990 [Providencia stuartii]MBQ0458604.1 hypothetical protein [Providencia stuartii]MDN7225340.1 hypothetical protein [Providencia stuartii]